MNIIRQVASSIVKFKYMKRIIFYFCIAFGISLANTVYHIPIEGTIDLGLPPFIERSIAEAEENNAKAIIFEVNTFGGRVDAATQIKDAILDSKVPTVAFINKRAISAGALISLSCEKVFMAGGATIGATTAVDMQGNNDGGFDITFFFFRYKDGSLKWLPIFNTHLAIKDRKGTNTEYVIALIPLGGYVKMAGSLDESFDTKLTGSPDEFSSKTVLQKIWILSAGVIMNIITAFVIFTGITLFSY